MAKKRITSITDNSKWVAPKTKKKRKAVCTKRGKMQRNIEDQFEQQLQAAETHCKAALEVMDQSSSKLIYDHVCSVLEDLVEKTRQEVMVPGNIIAVKSSTNGKKRLCLSPFSKSILRKWFDDHFHHPYPSEEEKESLSRQAEISVDQVNNWFINTRVRAWKPKVKAILNQDAAGNSTELEAMMDKIQAPYQETSSLCR